MRRRMARLGIVLGVSIGTVAAIPALTPAALADGCSSSSIAIAVDCVQVAGVVAVSSKPTEPKTTGCVKDDCGTVNRGGLTFHKARKDQPAPPSAPKPKAGKPENTAPRGAVLGIQLSRFEREHSDFFRGTYSPTLPDPSGWYNGVYRNPIPAIVEAPPPGSWSGITAPAAFTSVVLGMLLLVSAYSFRRLMLN